MHDAGLQPLLAEDLLVLSLGRELGAQTPWDSLNCVVIGALVADLIERKRLAVRHSRELEDDTIETIETVTTGDEVLDRTLQVLDGSSIALTRPAVSRANRIWYRRARRRLLATGKVEDRDIVRWFEGGWRCSEFHQLAPTLLRQLLTLYEELWSMHEVLHARISVDPNAPDFGIDQARCRHVRERLRALALGDVADGAAQTYVAALCGSWEPAWLRKSLCDDNHENDIVMRNGRSHLQNDVLARTVAHIIVSWETHLLCVP